jgi:hypothetical protein
MSKIEGPETIETLLPSLHGQSAKVLDYLASHGEANPSQISKELGIARSSLYKIISDLWQARLVDLHEPAKVARNAHHRGRTGSEVLSRDFKITLENLAGVPRLEITPRNVAAFDLLHKSSGKLFVERHGMEKFAKFMQLYEEYTNGKTPAFLMAKELGAERFEVELLIGDAEKFTKPQSPKKKKRATK